MNDWILIGILITTLFILGASRLTACIQAVKIQGILLSFLPLLHPGSFHDPHSLVMFVGTLGIKGIGIPLLLLRSIREATIRREIEPMISRHFTLLTGGALMCVAFSWKSFLPMGGQTPLLVPTALTTVLFGFLLLVTRTQAVTQVIGFLVLENGVFLFGTTLAADFPFTVELGVLLDLLVGIFVMGIMIFHIHRTFDHIGTGSPLSLKDAK